MKNPDRDIYIREIVTEWWDCFPAVAESICKDTNFTKFSEKLNSTAHDGGPAAIDLAFRELIDYMGSYHSDILDGSNEEESRSDDPALFLAELVSKSAGTVYSRSEYQALS